MTRFGSDYQVSRHTGVCAHTGEPLEPGSSCIATLCESEEHDGFERQDFSLAAWESGARPTGLYSYWKSTVPHPEQKQKLLVDDDVLMDLFTRLQEDIRPQRIAFRFVLGLILMRKKQFRFVGRTERDSERDGEVWLLRPRGADPDQPPVELVNPRLSDDDVRELTEQLSEVLNGEL